MITNTLEFQKYCWTKLYSKVEFILLPLGGNYDSHFDNVVTNINPQTSMDPILMLIGTTKPEMAELVSELDASTDETRIQEIYNTILNTIADENLTTPLVYMHQLAIYSDKVKDYTFPMDSNFTSIQNIKVK